MRGRPREETEAAAETAAAAETGAAAETAAARSRGGDAAAGAAEAAASAEETEAAEETAAARFLLPPSAEPEAAGSPLAVPEAAAEPEAEGFIISATPRFSACFTMSFSRASIFSRLSPDSRFILW